MEQSILCQLIAKRIDPTKFQLWGMEVKWMSETDNTLENNAIVADVIANYDVLAAALQVELDAERKKDSYKTEADPIYLEWQVLAALNHEDAEAKHTEWLAKRAEIQDRYK